jgi:hypothetical protein
MLNNDKILQSLGLVAERLRDVNKRIDSLQEAEASTRSARLEAQRRERLRNDAIVMAEAAREDAARAKAAADEEERQERYRQRRIKDHENGKFTATQNIFNDALSGFGRTIEPAPEGMSYTRYLRRCADAAQRYLPGGHPYASYNFFGSRRRAKRDPHQLRRFRLG